MRIVSLSTSATAAVVGRMLAFFAILVPLSACSTLEDVLMPSPQQVAIPEVPPPTEARTRPPKAESVAPAPQPVPERKVASIEPDRLIGLNPDAVGGVLGRPDGRTKDEMAFAWTYTGSKCALQLYFYPDVTTGSMRVLKYEFRHKVPSSSDKACLNTIMAARKG